MNDAESVLVFKMLLDVFDLFFGCILIKILHPLRKTFDFGLSKDECSNNIDLVMNVVHLEWSDCLRLDNLEIDVSAAQRVEDAR